MPSGQPARQKADTFVAIGAWKRRSASSGAPREGRQSLKTDPAGRCRWIAHPCICGLGTAQPAVCPGCVLSWHLSMRKKEGASGDDVLFTDVYRNIDKAEVVRAMQAATPTMSEVPIDGHSIRRTGAQWITAAEVDPVDDAAIGGVRPCAPTSRTPAPSGRALLAPGGAAKWEAVDSSPITG